MKVLENVTKVDAKFIIILKVQISFLAQLLVRHIKSIINLTGIVNV